jgi:hypothetical protein
MSDKYIPEFDSSSSMLFSLGKYLFQDPGPVGLLPKLPIKLADAINKLPKNLLMSLFTAGGAKESIGFNKLKKLDDKIISNWIVSAYPEKKYPAVMIGSPNGALIHVCAMLDIPWIPQTILLALTRKMHPDELLKDMEWGWSAVSIMRKTLPYFRFHQMHDPIQDRRMVTSGYEYLNGSNRITRFLKKQGSKLRHWEVPKEYEDVPEAEWGFADELSKSVQAYAERRGHRLLFIRYRHPEDVSTFCADLTGWWYEKNGIRPRRLLIECFALLSPWWTARTGSIPFWIAFNTQRSMESFKRYIEKQNRNYAQIFAMIMPNAVEGIGLVPVAQWLKVMKKYAVKSGLIGTDEKVYPYDIGTFIKYYKDLQIKIKERHYMPRTLGVNDFFTFIKKNKRRPKLSFIFR